MGLDMWANKSKPSVNDEQIQIADWRKHNRLHGYMEQLWEDKGCPNANGDIPESFNCVPLELTIDDLEDLRATIKERQLPETQGFFFGHDSYDYEGLDEADEYDLKFVDNAIKAIKEGYDVTYNSWW